MKLLFVLSEYLPDSGGGIISYYAGVLPHLVKAGHQVDVLVASASGLDRAGTEIDGVRISYLTSASLRQFEGRFERFKWQHPSFHAFLPVAWAAHHQADGGAGYDLVETTDFPMLYAPWVVSGGKVPVNLSLHGSPGQLDWYESPGAPSIDSDSMRWVEQAAFTSAFAVQANSRANAGFWESQTRREIPILMPAYLARQVPTAEPVRDSTGIVVGRLQHWKGPHVLCEALAELPEVKVRWIGREVNDPLTGEPISKSLASLFQQVFGTRMIPVAPMPNELVRAEIAAAEFLCVPSTWDVFNLTAVEAMELGTPVICSTAAGAAMLIEDGINGYLFDPARPKTLADAVFRLQQLAPDARRLLIDAARRTVVESLDPEKLAMERIDYYSRLMASPPDRSAVAWLDVALSPRVETRGATSLLGGFTVVDLLKSACLQASRGISRRIGGGR